MQNNREQASLLLDYYESLLTDHQKDILIEYFNEDLSMNEIADNYHISKSAVQDLIKRTYKQLEDYENKLHLIEKDNKLHEILLKMEKENNELLDIYSKQIEKLI